MQVGDVVVPMDGWQRGGLRSGCEAYTHAICMSLEPFVLVSEQADMVWYHAEPYKYVGLCKADAAIVARCRERLEGRKPWYSRLFRRDSCG